MRLIDSSNARVRIVVGVHAEAERFIIPNGRSPPVIFVVAETVHLLGHAVLLHLRLLMAFAFLLALSFFLELLSGVFRDFFLDRGWAVGQEYES